MKLQRNLGTEVFADFSVFFQFFLPFGAFFGGLAFETN
jgi:hypothetical protein